MDIAVTLPVDQPFPHAMKEDVDSLLQQQAAIVELGESAQTLHEEQAVMDKAVALVSRTLGVEYCEVFELLPDGGGLLLRSGAGWNEELIGHTTAAIESGSRLSQLLSSNNFATLEESGPGPGDSDILLLRSLGVVSGLCAVIPQQCKPGPYGILGAHSTTGRDFTDQHTGFLRAVANIIATDVERKRAEREIQLVRNVALAVGLATDLQGALHSALEKVLAATSWDYAEAWLPSADGKLLELGPTVAHGAVRTDGFNRASLTTTFGPDEGLPGRVWVSRKSEWVIDISAQSNQEYLRSDLARGANLHTALALPLVSRDAVLAVLTFYLSSRRRRDERIVELITDAFSSVGPLVERKQAENELRESEARKGAILESALDCIITMDQEGRIVEFNSAAEHTFGFRPEDMVGRTVGETIVPPRLREAYKHGLAHFMRTGQGPILGHRIEMPALRADGSEFIAELAVTCTRLRGGQPFFTAYLRDITSRRQAQEELCAARDQLEQHVKERTADLLAANEQLREEMAQRKRAEEQVRKSLTQLAHVARHATMGELAAGLAHELNQPLCAIVNFAEACLTMLEKGSAPDELNEAITQVARQAERAGEVVRRLREFIRRREPMLVEADTNHLVHEVIALTHAEAEEYNAKLILQLAPDLPAVLADAIQIQQVILNLIRNGFQAMNNTQIGERVLGITTTRFGESHIEIAVTDRGIGIPADGCDRIFEPFFSTKATGMGMGLSISRSIIEAHQGRLWLTPNSDRGVTFHFTLPIVRRRKDGRGSQADCVRRG